MERGRVKFGMQGKGYRCVLKRAKEMWKRYGRERKKVGRIKGEKGNGTYRKRV